MSECVLPDDVIRGCPRAAFANEGRDAWSPYLVQLPAASDDLAEKSDKLGAGVRWADLPITLPFWVSHAV